MDAGKPYEDRTLLPVTCRSSALEGTGSVDGLKHGASLRWSVLQLTRLMWLLGLLIPAAASHDRVLGPIVSAIISVKGRDLHVTILSALNNWWLRCLHLDHFGHCLCRSSVGAELKNLDGSMAFQMEMNHNMDYQI